VAGTRARRALALLALVGSLAGCSGAQSRRATAAGNAAATSTATTAVAPTTTVPPSSRLDVTAVEYQYQTAGPVNLAAGEVTVSLRNGGTEAHHGQLLRLHDGVTADDVDSAASDDPSGAPLLALGDEVGGPGTVSPDGTAQSTQRLAPGSYVMFCLVRGPSGETHVIDGMLAQFDVTAQRAAHSTPRPTADLRLTDSGFELPSPFPRHGVLRVTNQGRQPHEVTFLRLPPGRTESAIRPYLRVLRASSMLQPPPPFTAAGGVAAMSPGETAIVPVSLRPGDYLAICLVRGRDGEPHAVHGMVAHFTVR